MRLFPLALSLLALGAAAPGHADLAGSYDVTGTNPDESAYGGTLLVAARGPVYQFSWATGNDYEGVGLQGNDAVAVGYGGEGCGAVIYRVGGDGTLHGRWALYGTEAVGTERARRTSGSGLAGTYRIEGTNPDGSPYAGSLLVERDGPAYTLTWEAGGTYVGAGILMDDEFGASYGGEACGVAVYTVRGADLDGQWTSHGAGAVGTERATRR